MIRMFKYMVIRYLRLCLNGGGGRWGLAPFPSGLKRANSSELSSSLPLTWLELIGMSITLSSDESWNALNRSGGGFRGLRLGSGGGDAFLARDDLGLRGFAGSSSDDSERSRCLRDDGDCARRDCFLGGASGVGRFSSSSSDSVSL